MPMADRSEQERKARLYLDAMSKLTTQASASHPIVAAKPSSECERIHQIILSNLATKDD
jgi:hypothetical protein